MYTDWVQLLVLVLYLRKRILTGGTVGRVARTPHSSREKLQGATGRKVPHSSRVEELLGASHQLLYARSAENIVKIKRNWIVTKEFIRKSGAVKSVVKWLQGQPASRITS